MVSSSTTTAGAATGTTTGANIQEPGGRLQPNAQGVATTAAATPPRNWIVQLSHFGDPDGIEVVDAPLPTAGRGDVRVRVLASSLEYTDVVIRRHFYPQTLARKRRIPGRAEAPAAEKHERAVQYFKRR